MRRRSQLTCRDVARRASDLLDGLLPEAARLAVEAHVLACSDCTRFLAQLEESVLLTQSLLTSAPPDADALQALIADITRAIEVGPAPR